MIRTLALAALLALSLDFGYAQAPAFEVASITPCQPGTPEPPAEHMGMLQFVYPGGRFEARAIDVKYLLEWAYDIQPAEHTGGPSWLETDRYDIVAKADGNPTEAQMKLLVRTLLADRFQLKLHRESKELSAYVISLGKVAPKLFPPKEGETHQLRIAPQTGPDQKVASFHVAATRYSLEQLTYVFARQLGDVIVNRTGLDGEYDFTLDLTPDEHRPTPLDASILIAAMKDQLGLALKYEKTPVDIFVIDSAGKVAVGN